MKDQDYIQKIQKELQSLPKESLPLLLNYIKELKKHSSENVQFTSNLRKILLEDTEVLNKLAQ